jgi:hypothetical protein
MMRAFLAVLRFFRTLYCSVLSVTFACISNVSALPRLFSHVCAAGLYAANWKVKDRSWI